MWIRARQMRVRERALALVFVHTKAVPIVRGTAACGMGGPPYFVGVFEAFGSVVNVHPHAHALCSEGILDREGEFHALPADCDWSALEELFRHVLLALLVARERLHRLACYLPVLSLGRMEYAPGASKVLCKNDAAHGYGTVAYEPLEFMALVLAHVPEPHEVRVRYYGAASSTIRRGGRNGRLAGNADGAGNAAGLALGSLGAHEVVAILN